MKLWQFGSSLVGLASWVSLVSATHTIQGRLTNLTTLALGTEAVLTTYNEWIEYTPVLQDQTFKFELIEAGEYLLRVQDGLHQFQWYHLQVPQLESATPVVSLFKPGYAKIEGTIIPGWPITIPAIGVLVYKDPERTFNPIAFLTANPLYLLLAIGVVITLFGPKLMEYFDPEGYAEVKGQSASSQEMISSIQGADLTGALSKYLAGTAAAAPAPGAAMGGASEGGSVITSAPGTLAGGEKVVGAAPGVPVAPGGTPGKKGGKKRR